MSFYKSLGFVAQGGVYLEDEQKHIEMVLRYDGDGGDTGDDREISVVAGK